MAVCSEHLLLLISRRFLAFGTITWIICCRLQTPRLIRKNSSSRSISKGPEERSRTTRSRRWDWSAAGGVVGGGDLERFLLLLLSERSRKDRRKDE
jgi:hypothetical protein